MIPQLKKKIRLSFYPYTYVRVAVMRTLLLRAADYHKILKMDFNEIARYLEETNYKQSIDKYASHLQGAELIEQALNDDLAATFAKLRRISSPELALLINEYLKRKDIEDIKTVLRSVYTAVDQKTAEENISGTGTLNKHQLIALFKLGSIEKILQNIPFIPFERLSNAYKLFKVDNSLAGLENALDRFYYRNLLEFTNRIPNQGDIFKNFLLKEIEIVNLLTIIRLKHAEADRKTMISYLILTNDEHYQHLLSKLVDADIPTIIKLTQQYDYHDVLAAGLAHYEKTRSLIALEASLFTHLLKKSIHLLHQNLLSIDVILGFLLAKDMEVRNLRLITKGKRLGIDESFIEEQLVY